ncbi:MAG: nucleotidyl transferase [Elusimicrobia bacterium]|nr:MAG: nucleotidyl transferase [Elusimicrobiota bacterium]KAF0157312.1 MAG: nucleotidyl transferase [Elusimicrobiota bacterium]
MKKSDFTAVVPVAGAGTRLRPHTYTYPKVLLTVGNKPIIGHILDDLAAAGIKKICMVTGYLGDKIKTYVSSAYPGLDVDYVEQPEPKGLGHAIWMTRSRVTGPMLVMLGDTILSADLSKFLGGREDCIAVKEVPDPRRFGVVEVKNGYISAMVEKPEKPRTNLAIVGIYSFRNSSQLYGSLQRLVDSGTTTRGEIQFTDAMAMMVRRGHRIKPVKIEGWYDCGKPETLLETNRFILGRGAGGTMRHSVPKASGTLIVPPVYIAPGAEVRDSIIGPHVSVGPGCRIERSIISDSIINEEAQVSDINLAGSLIGPSAVVLGRRYKLNVGENSEVIFGTGDIAPGT